MVIPDEELVEEYYEYRQQLDQMSADFRDVITHPNYSLPHLKPGRLVKIKYQDMDFGWGVVINYQKRLPPKVSSCCESRARASELSLYTEPTYAQSRGIASTRAIYCRRLTQLRFRIDGTHTERPSDHACNARRCTTLSPWAEGGSTCRARAAIYVQCYQPSKNIPAEGSTTAVRTRDCVEKRIGSSATVSGRNHAIRPNRGHGNQGREIQGTRQGTSPVGCYISMLMQFPDEYRRSKLWSKRCTQAHCTRILVFPSSTRNTRRNEKRRSASARSRNGSTRPTMFCSWKSSSHGSAYSGG